MDPKVLIIRALEACNAGCFMCDFAYSDDSYQLSRSELRKILDAARGQGIKLVRLTGGEPLLLSELYGILKDIKAEGLFTSLISNGWHLPSRQVGLVDSGLDQIIVSIDGPSARHHDKFRRLEGLFDRIVSGIEGIKRLQPKLLVRVNSVVGPHNLHLISSIWYLLRDLAVDQWSLIPLKRENGAWGQMSLTTIEESMATLRAQVERDKSLGANKVPRILGYGLDLFGRNAIERARLLQNGRNITPHETCHLVDQVRYYTPKNGAVFPCNCVPHRFDGKDHFEFWGPNSLTDDGLASVRAWLRANGPKLCTGCEPLNAALGDQAIDLDDDPFGF